MLKCLSSAIALSCAAFLTAAPSVHAGSMAWEVFAQSPGGLAAIAMGVATVGACGEPYAFNQDEDGDKVRVTILCDESDNETAVIITFDRIGPSLLVRQVDLAG